MLGMGKPGLGRKLRALPTSLKRAPGGRCYTMGRTNKQGAAGVRQLGARRHFLRVCACSPCSLLPPLASIPQVALAYGSADVGTDMNGSGLKQRHR